MLGIKLIEIDVEHPNDINSSSYLLVRMASGMSCLASGVLGSTLVLE